METNRAVVTRVIRSQDQWRGLLARFAASDMTVRNFCRAEGVSEAAFYRRSAELGEVPMEPNARAAAPFVDLGSLGTTAKSSGRVEVSIDLGDGIVLTVVRS